MIHVAERKTHRGKMIHQHVFVLHRAESSVTDQRHQGIGRVRAYIDYSEIGQPPHFGNDSEGAVPDKTQSGGNLQHPVNAAFGVFQQVYDTLLIHCL